MISPWMSSWKESLRSAMTVVVGAVALSAIGSGAQAQTRTAPAPASDNGYVEAVAQSGFGNVTSQSFGGEIGVNVRPDLIIFVEGGLVRDVATSEIGANAQVIAGALTQATGGVTYSVKEPVTFGVAGVRYPIRLTRFPLQPYVLGGVGIAKVKQDAKFFIAGTDQTANLQQYGVTLGTDLSGSFNKAMFTLGGGLVYPVWQRLIVDVQFRYGRILADGQGINVSRAGIGVGFRF